MTNSFKKLGFSGVTLILATSSAVAQFTIDVQLRNRFELRDGYQKLSDGATPAAFISQRSRISFGYATDDLRLKFTPQDVRVWGDEKQSSSTGVFGDEASLELLEAYAEIRTGHSGWLSVGRQQLVYDNERILSARNWNQSGLAYDAVVYKWSGNKTAAHIGSSWNSTGENLKDNLYDPARIKSLSFLWIQNALAENWSLSLLHVASGVTRSETENALYFRQTTGLYTTLKSGDWKIWSDFFYQYGKNGSGQTVSAYLFDAEVSWKPGELMPGANISYLSGNSKTGEEQTTDHLFDMLYGTRHRYFGMIDYFRNFGSDTRQGGLIDYSVFLDYQFSPKTSIRNTSHYFQLAKTNPNTPDDKKLGFENDLLFKHQFRSWGSVEAGYSFFLPTSTLRTIQGVEDNSFSQFLYVQLTINPSLLNLNTKK